MISRTDRLAVLTKMATGIIPGGGVYSPQHSAGSRNCPTCGRPLGLANGLESQGSKYKPLPFKTTPANPYFRGMMDRMNDDMQELDRREYKRGYGRRGIPL